MNHLPFVLFLWCILHVSFAIDLTLTGEAIFILSQNDTSQTPFEMAMRDVRVDFYRAFGWYAIPADPKTTACPLDGPKISRVYFGTFANLNLPSSFDKSSCYNGKEAHCVRVFFSAEYGYCIAAVSNDMRGAIYAAYTFSEEILGMDPLYRFSGIEIDMYENGIKVPSDLNIVYNAPTFTYRAIFNNDEDLLGGWGADPLGESVHSSTVFDWLFETALRLKANMAIVGTVPYPDEPSLDLAGRRGIIVTNHHFNLLGTNTFRFPSSIKNEYNWRIAPDTTTFVWKSSIDAMERLPEVVWSVGYRGLNDYPAPCTNCTDKERGETLSHVIGNMTSWLNPNDNVITYLWSEGLPLFDKGYLKVPPQVGIILTDSGNGYIGGLDHAHIAEGIYTHTAMLNGWCNQLTEMVPASRHFSQIGQFASKAKKTKYAIINHSDLRPVLLSTEAVFKFLWNPNAFANDPNATLFTLNWCMKKYNVSPTQAGEIAKLYDRYYHIPYVWIGISENHLANVINDLSSSFYNDLVKNHSVGNTTITKAQKDQPKPDLLKYIDSLFNDSKALMKSLNLRKDAENLFKTHILLQQGFHHYCNAIITKLCGAAYTYNKSPQQAITLVNSSLEDFNSLFAMAREAETGVFRGMYMFDQLVDFHRTRTIVRRLQRQILKAKCQLPLKPFQYYTFTYYQLPHQANYPYIHGNDSVNIYEFVRIRCNNDKCCTNNASGGKFHVGGACAGAVVQMDVLSSSCKIRYSTSKQVPDNSDPMYAKPITVSKRTTISAACFLANGQRSSVDVSVKLFDLF